MRLLITGARGFTGQHLIAAARASDVDVQALDARLDDVDALATEVSTRAPTHVVHLAGISSVTHGDTLGFYRVNVLGTQNLLDALARLPKPPERVIVASSAAVYGNAATSPIPEDAPPAPRSHYGISKLAMECVADGFRDRLAVGVIRAFNYTGVGHDQRFVIPKLVRHFARREPRIELGNLDVEREFNDVRPFVQAYLDLVRLETMPPLLNLCSGRPVSLRQALDALERLTGHRIEVLVNPAFVRPGEVFRLTGDPARLHAALGPLPTIALEQTLEWMLAAEMQQPAPR